MSDANNHEDKPGLYRRATMAVNRTLYDDKTAQTVDEGVQALLSGHPIESFKKGWQANGDAARAVMDKLGLRQKDGGRGV